MAMAMEVVNVRGSQQATASCWELASGRDSGPERERMHVVIGIGVVPARSEELLQRTHTAHDASWHSRANLQTAYCQVA